MEKIEVVKHILRNTNHGSFVHQDGGYAWAPSNVALCKYWGKRDSELNLPCTSSLSVSLGRKGTYTHILPHPDHDIFNVNNATVPADSQFAQRLQKFLNLFRPKNAHYAITITTNVPIAAGMASSACGFASTVLALNNLYNWGLAKTDLSILARLGSGSACRSIWEGFVEWERGEDYNGLDSFAKPLPYIWPELRLGALVLSAKEKPLSSTRAMQITLETSPLYPRWPEQVACDLLTLKKAIAAKDFALLGATAEANAVHMHLLMLHAKPSIIYSLPETLAAMQQVIELRKSGVPVYFTQDAGPNLQLLFLAQDLAKVINAFPQVEVITPFADVAAEQLIIVNADDVEVDVGEKMAVHLQAKLHRAFSVLVLREHAGKIEVLLQQRSANKYHSANLWANTCCGHPRPGESIMQAATRRLHEEMGITATLHEIGSFHYQAKFADVGLVENELDHVLIGHQTAAEINANPNEVQAYAWVGLEELYYDLSQNPDKYVVWLQPVLEVLLEQR